MSEKNKAPSKHSSSVKFECKALPLRTAIYKFALKLTKNKEEAEDLTQETMLKAFESWDSFEYKSDRKCRNWLMTILMRKFVNSYRVKTRRIKRVAEFGEDIRESLHNFKSTDLSLARSIHEPSDSSKLPQQQEITEEIEAAVEALPEEFRLPMFLCLMDMYTYNEIAEITGLCLNTVKTRIHRGKKRLQKTLKEYRKNI